MVWYSQHMAKIFFFLFLILMPLAGNAAGEAGLFLNPASGAFFVGSTFDVSLVLDTKGIAVNTLEIDLEFPANKIQLVNPSVGQSIVQLWPAPPTFSNREGRMYFVGGIPSPGINTSDGVVLTLSFRVIAPGKGQISFGDKTSVLANDGKGTNILGKTRPAFFTFSIPPPQGPVISSPTHPDEESWYQNPNPLFIWQASEFGKAYSYAIDQNPAGFPDTIREGLETTASFENLENGIWYFHLREQAGSVWGGISHYAVHIDHQAPAVFTMHVTPGIRTSDRNPVFRFFTTDALSGFDHFAMKIIPLSVKEIQESFFFEVISPWQAPHFEPGRYQVVIRAFDKAGNTRDEVVAMNIVNVFTQFLSTEGIDLIFVLLSWPTVFSSVSIILLFLLFILFLFWHTHRHHLRHAFKDDIKKIFRLLSLS